jgi:hypothetical protein
VPPVRRPVVIPEQQHPVLRIEHDHPPGPPQPRPGRPLRLSSTLVHDHILAD